MSNDYEKISFCFDCYSSLSWYDGTICNPSTCKSSASNATGSIGSGGERGHTGRERVIDGTRTVSGTAQDMERLKNSDKGTLLIRYKTTSDTD